VHPKAEESAVGKVVMYSSVSVDGFVADENDQPGPLFDWLSSGDVSLDESGEVRVSQTSYDYTRPYWDQIGATLVGRHVFDMTDGWDGKPPSGIDHVVVVTHRPAPEGWDPEAPFHFVDGVEAAVAKAQELAGDRMVEVAAGEVGGQVLAAGLVDEVRMDVVPVVFGSGQPGASPALSGATLTDLSGYAKKFTANGDTRSGLRLRLRIAVPGRPADADPPQHLSEEHALSPPPPGAEPSRPPFGQRTRRAGRRWSQ
jgi:dihydrofolate reductase